MTKGKLKALVIGHGSIGQRHCEVLGSMKEFETPAIVSKRTETPYLCYPDLDRVPDIEAYDYFLICTETHLHRENLENLNDRVQNKTILVEKPLFDHIPEGVPFSFSNAVYVAYNLRFHPMTLYLREQCKEEQIFSGLLSVGQYLPHWRPGRDYKTIYSTDRNRGGGVLRDLSHELDYAQWIFGPIETFIGAFSGRISDLEMNADDCSTAICKTHEGTLLNIWLDCVSKVPSRKFLVHGKEHSWEGDFINGTVTRSDKQGNVHTESFKLNHKNQMYEAMHLDIIQEGGLACTFNQAVQTLKAITKLEWACADLPR